MFSRILLNFATKIKRSNAVNIQKCAKRLSSNQSAVELQGQCFILKE